MEGDVIVIVLIGGVIEARGVDVCEIMWLRKCHVDWVFTVGFCPHNHPSPYFYVVGTENQEFILWLAISCKKILGRHTRVKNIRDNRISHYS